MKKYLTKVPNNINCKNCGCNEVLNSKNICPIISICRGGCWSFYEENITDKFAGV